jgi:hypothetical protein
MKRIFFTSLKSLKKGVGSGVGSGYISLRYGSGDPDQDPHQNVTDPQHCFCHLHCSVAILHQANIFLFRGRILGRNWDKSLQSVPPCYSQSPLITDFTPPSPPPPNKSGLKLVCNVKNVYGNLKSENSQDYAQKLNEIGYFQEFGFSTAQLRKTCCTTKGSATICVLRLQSLETEKKSAGFTILATAISFSFISFGSFGAAIFLIVTL